LRRGGEDRLVARDRALDVGQLDLGQARRAQREVVARGRAGFARGARVEDLEQVGVPFVAREDRVQERERLFVARAVVQDGAQVLDRLVRLLQLLVVEARKLDAQRPAVRGHLNQLQLALEDLREVSERRARDVQLGQRVQRLDVVGVELEHGLPRAQRGLALIERAFVQRGDALRDRLLLVGVEDDLGVALQRLDQLGRTARLREQPLEREERVDVVGARRQGGPPGLDGLGGVVELLLAELRRDAPELGL
jgi:hypothetical protein